MHDGEGEGGGETSGVKGGEGDLRRQFSEEKDIPQ